MLTRISVKNFKSLRDVTLNLGQRNVLVGANMAGKSNLIGLLRFIHDITFPSQPGTWALSNAVFARGGFDELSWKGGTEQTILIELSGTTSAHGPLWTWDYSISIQGGPRGNLRVANERLQIKRRPDLPPDDLIESVGTDRFLCSIQNQRLTSIPDAGRSGIELDFPDWPGYFLRTMIAGWRFYELLPAVMRSANPTAASLFLDKHGENLSQWLLNLQSRYGESFARIQAVLKDSLPQVKGLFTLPTQQSTVLLGSHEKHLNRPVMLSDMSAGELVFIAYLSLIFSPPDLSGTLYCIEDLESYLHPRLIETLLEVLRQSQEEWERKHQAAQILMTTHSPLVVDKTDLDEIIFVEKKDGATLYSRPEDTASLRKLLQDGEVGLGDLAFSGALSDASR